MDFMEVSGFASGGEEVLFVVGLVQSLGGADRSSQRVFPLG